MNALHMGLYDPKLLDGLDSGSPEAVDAAIDVAMQAGELAKLCAVALDAVAYESRIGPEPAEIAKIASRVLFECADDMAVAVDAIRG